LVPVTMMTTAMRTHVRYRGGVCALGL
jgi:hypothetical protein